MGADFAQQLVVIERFDDIIVGLSIEAICPVGLRPPAGDENTVTVESGSSPTWPSASRAPSPRY